MAAPPVPLVGYVRVSSVAGRRDERFQLLRYGPRAYKWLAWFTDLTGPG